MEKKIYNAINSVLKAGSKDRHEPQMDRIEIFQDTLEWIRTDSDYLLLYEKQKKKQKCFMKTIIRNLILPEQRSKKLL